MRTSALFRIPVMLAVALCATLQLSSCTTDSSTKARSQATRASFPAAQGEADSLRTLSFGDSISVSVWGYPEFNARVEVKPNGTISIPLIGEVPVAAMTRLQLHEAIKRRLSEYIKGEARVALSVDFTPERITVLGGVTHPGSFAVVRELPLLEVLAQAGGWTEQSDLTSILIRRGSPGVDEKAVVEFDLEDALDQYVQGGGIPTVRPGDVVIVPREDNLAVQFGQAMVQATSLLFLFWLLR